MVDSRKLGTSSIETLELKFMTSPKFLEIHELANIGGIPKSYLNFLKIL